MAKLKWNSDDFNSSADQTGVSHRPGQNLKQGYNHRQLQRGLVGWWPLHTTTGSALDLSGNGNNGSLNGGVTRGVAGKAGLRAMSFDGSDDYIDLGFTALSLPVTVSAWIYTTTTSSSTNRAVLSNYNTTSDDFTLGINNNSDGTCFLSADKTGFSETSSGKISANRWHHLVGIIDSNGNDIYLDTNQLIKDDNSGSTGTIDNTNNFLIGDRPNSDSPWTGKICDLRIYNRSLSSNEIQMLYNLGNADTANPPGNNSGGISYWKLDEDSGSTATDSWSTNDGSISNGGDSTVVGASGVRKGGYRFDGTNDRVELPDLGLDNSSDFTITAWTNSDTTGIVQNIFGRFDGTDDLLEYRLDSTDVLKLIVGHSGGNNINVSTNSLPVDEWLFTAASFDSSKPEAKLFVNGDFKASQSATVDDFATSSGPWIGARSDGANYFDGLIDDVRIYKRVLKPHEIQQLYRYGTRGVDLNRRLVDQ